MEKAEENQPKKERISREMTFEEFYETYYFRLVGYCRAFPSVPVDTAEDLAEDAFAELWRHWTQLESHAEFVLLMWVKKAIALLAKAQSRKRAKEPLFVEFNEQIDETQVEQDSQQSMEDRIAEDDAYLQYLSEIDKRLTPNERQLFDCLILKKLSVRQTAKRLSKTETAVKVGAVRLRARLREKILPELFSKTDGS